jgi:protoheme IX farnesyltransferase
MFLLAAIRVWFDASDRSARQMFGFSILYLFALFALLIVDAQGGAA